MPRSSLRAIFIILAILTFFNVSCGRLPPSEDISQPTATVDSSRPTTTPIPTTKVHPTSQPVITSSQLNNPHYVLDVDLDFAGQSVSVLEDLTIPHPGNETMSGIVLVVPPANWRDVFFLSELTSTSHTISGYYLEGIQLKISLEEPGWKPGENLVLNINFMLALPEQGAGSDLGHTPFGYLDRQINLVDWFPMAPPFSVDDGWLIHPPWIFGEFLVYPIADYEVEITVTDPELVVAASSLPYQQTNNSRKYRLENARNFVFSVSPDYQIIKGDAGGTSVLGYFFPEDPSAGRAAFDATREAIVLFSTLYGPYTQESISVIQADFYGSIEYQGLFFLNQSWFQSYNGTDRSYLVLIAVHETAHMWWYGQVANDQALEPWLDEAFCTFSELAYYQNLNPWAESWWWRTRVENYQPEGRINRSIYQFENEDDPYLAYRDATYLQGAKFLSTLKDVLGDDAFYTFLQEYVLLYQGQIASGEDFFNLLGEYLDLEEQEWMGEYFE